MMACVLHVHVCDSHVDIPRLIVSIVVAVVAMYGECWLVWLMKRFSTLTFKQFFNFDWTALAPVQRSLASKIFRVVQCIPEMVI